MILCIPSRNPCGPFQLDWSTASCPHSVCIHHASCYPSISGSSLMVFFRSDDTLDRLGHQVLNETWAEFPELAQDQIAMTWLLYDSGDEARGFSYRGIQTIYPASVVKLFYLVALHELQERGQIERSAELDRAVQKMIVESSNDATSLVVDTLTDTTSGPELPHHIYESWKFQRNSVNRYLESLEWEELEGVNVNQKTWCEGPFGRERAFLGPSFENRNMLTTNAVARLLQSIVRGEAVSRVRSRAMMDLMQRSLQPDDKTENRDMIKGFLGEGLPPSARIWSKVGFTSQVRHDAAYIELSDECRMLLVVFLQGPEHSKNERILPFIARQACSSACAHLQTSCPEGDRVYKEQATIQVQ